MIRQAILPLMLPLFLLGCQEAIDHEKPTCSIQGLMDGDVVETAQGLRLAGSFTDNTGLLQFKFTVSGIDSLNGIAADSTISFIYIGGFPDRPVTFFLDELIPLSDTTFNGQYFATLTCVDVEGNEALRDTVRFSIRNSIDSEPPVINVGGIAKDDTLTLGQGFSLSGAITDSQSLIYSYIFIGRTDRTFEKLSFDFLGIQDNTVSFDAIGLYFQVDTTWAKGDYVVYLTAWDNYSGVSHSIPFHVKY